MIHIVKEKQTLLEALTAIAPDSSKTTLRDWIKHGRIHVDGKKQSVANLTVEPDQKIELLNQPQKAIELGIRIVYKDQHIVAINKPSGVLSVATATEKEATAHCALKNHFHPRRVFVVHRLDQDTSGVMLFALTEEARDQLKIIFEKHDIQRCYTAIVEGKLPIGSTGTWQCFLYEDERFKVHAVEENRSPPPHAKLATTHYTVLGTRGPFSRLLLKLETGRKNQIRVHCQKAGCPVIGDDKYGYSGTHTKRLALHAHTLELCHPVTGKPLHFESKAPAYFAHLCP